VLQKYRLDGDAYGSRYGTIHIAFSIEDLLDITL
ncbi:MAG: hypothetical protein ACI9MJ_001141, partial [Alphaproteobacteria bacterium]